MQSSYLTVEVDSDAAYYVGIVDWCKSVGLASLCLKIVLAG